MTQMAQITRRNSLFVFICVICGFYSLDSVHEAAGVEQPARVELFFHLTHQPDVAARPAPDRQGALPLRRATRQDEIAVSGDGLQFNLVDYQPCYRTEAGTGCAMGFAEWL